MQHSHLPSAEVFFYPQNLAWTPKNDEVPYMLLYIEGTKIRNKTKCTPYFKMQWEPCSVDPKFMKLCQNVNSHKSRSSSKLGHVGSKIRLLG